MCVSISVTSKGLGASGPHLNSVGLAQPPAPSPQPLHARDHVPQACCFLVQQQAPGKGSSEIPGSEASSGDQHHPPLQLRPSLPCLYPLPHLSQTPTAAPAAWGAFPAVGEDWGRNAGNGKGMLGMSESGRGRSLWGCVKSCLPEPLR